MGIENQNGVANKNGKRKPRPKKPKVPVEKPTFVTAKKQEIFREQNTTVLVKFETKQSRFAVPTSPIVIPETSKPQQLNAIVAKMLKSSSYEGKVPEFDFLVEGVLLNKELHYVIEKSETLSREVEIPIEYMEAQPMPENKESLQHDDWVSCLHFDSRSELLITGCFDNSIHLWRPALPSTMGGDWLSNQASAHVLKLANAHDFYIQQVQWLPGGKDMFVSTSMDQTARVWRYNPSSTTVDCLYMCKGHRKTVDALACSPDGRVFATGAHEGTIKFWTTDNSNLADNKPAAKKQKIDAKKPKKKTPVATLMAHSDGDGVAALVYCSLSTLASAAQDHSVRLWDTEARVRKCQYEAPTVCRAMDSSPFEVEQLLVSTDSDCVVRLIDGRTDGTLQLTQKYDNHTLPITGVKYSRYNANHFVTSSHDHKVKVWDFRGPREPLYDIVSHTDKVMCVDWSCPKVIFSGGADTNVKLTSFYQ